MLAYYELKSDTQKPLTVELLDASGRVRACLASDTPVKPIDTEAIIVQPDLAAAGATSGNHGRNASRGAECRGAARIWRRPTSGSGGPASCGCLSSTAAEADRYGRGAGAGGTGARARLAAGKLHGSADGGGKGVHTGRRRCWPILATLPSNAEAPDDGDDNH